MQFTRAEAFAPATMANVGVGFDILGLALCEPGDTVAAELCDEPGAVVISIEGDGGRLTLDSDKNTASVAANSALKLIGAWQGVKLTIYKDLPLASGLGSSAASAVAAAAAVNALFGSPLTKRELLLASLDGEAAVSGYHADNVAPCLFGGITLIGGTHAQDVRQLPCPDDMRLALITPDVPVPTSEARAVLPQMISLKMMVAQTSAVAQLIDALYRGDLEAVGKVMEQDGVIEPARAHLTPMLYEVRAAAKRAGAYGLVISGAGPTLCGVCDSDAISSKVMAAMQAVYDEAGISAVSRCTKVSEDGVRVLSLT